MLITNNSSIKGGVKMIEMFLRQRVSDGWYQSACFNLDSIPLKNNLTNEAI